jgi:signal transduction histidine kinase/CheY-like chemotaxis protein
VVESIDVWSMSLRPVAAPLIALLGALVFQLLASLIGHGRARIRPSPWWLGMMGVAIATVAARAVHRSTADVDVALMAVRAQFALGLLVVPIATGAIEAVLAYPRSSRALLAVGAVAVALLVVTLATTWIVPATAAVRTDALGGEFYAATGHRTLLLSAFYVGAAVLLVVRMRRMPAASRWSFRIGAVLLLSTGVNDVLLSAGLIDSIHLYEYGLAGLAATATVFVQRRADDLQRELESQVAERTEALASALAEVRRGEDRYRILADATSEAVVVVDGREVVDVNRAFVELCQPSEQVIGQPIEQVLEARVAADDRTTLAPLVAGEAAGPIELRVHRPDGTTLDVELRAVAGAGARRVLLARDVSAQKVLQRQLLRADRLAAMGTLAAGTAHEINNPLTFVVSNAALLDEMLAADGAALDVAEARALLADVSSGGERIRIIVRDLVALVRDPGDVPTPVDVRAILESSLAIAGNRLRHRARVVRRYAPDLPLVAGNEVRLGQVFLNLLLNAADALPDGHAEAHTVTAEAEADAEGVVVRISDTGTGMTPAVRDRIFDPFYTTKDIGSGTGLGLSVSLGIVAALGGRIEVESQPGHGSTFAVHLRAVTSPLPAPPTTTPPTTIPVDGGRVLVIDDEPVVARTMARLLAPLATEVVTNGRDALAACTRADYDAIVCDVLMPAVTGMELYDQLRATAPALAARIVFVTGGAFTDEARAFLARVPNPVLEKPVAADALRAAIALVRPRRDG